jgi:glycosyltransferase involved in cell wall biosynthesis
VYLACSHYVRRWFISSSKVDPSSVHTAHAGVDPLLFFPEETQEKMPLRLLYVGRLDPNKGVDVAVDAFRILKERNLPVTLTVAGGGWFYKRRHRTEEKFVLNLSKSMGILNVEWLGHVPRRWLPEVVRRHDIALVLSRSQEPFGLVVLEAMASGVAVLASSRGGLTESCGEAGVLADPDRPNEIADLLEALAKEPNKLRELKTKAVQRARRARWIDTAEVLLGAIRQTRKT